MLAIAPSSSKMFTRPLTDVPIQGIKEFALSKDTVPYQDPILGMHFNIKMIFVWIILIQIDLRQL
jgi:hypothetical protein